MGGYLKECPQRSRPGICDSHEAGQAGHLLAEGAAVRKPAGVTLWCVPGAWSRAGGNEMR